MARYGCAVADRDEIVSFLDELLDAPGFPDYCPNGLQVPGATEVELVLSGVSGRLELFERAAREERAVIFMDEFDALCPARSEGDNQVNNRIVAELLARTDGVAGSAKGTILIMATNYPWRIDSAMLSRTGNRFYIPLPDEPLTL